MRYLDYLFRHSDQLEGSTPSQVLKMAQGVYSFWKGSRKRLFTVRPLSPNEIPKVEARPLSVDQDGVVVGERVG